MFIYFVTTLVLSATLLGIFYNGVPIESFIFPVDGFLVLSQHEISNLFITQQFVNFGSANTTILLVNFIERIYFFLISLTGASFIESQKLLYFLQIFVSIFLPFLGFIRLDKYFNDKSKPDKLICFVLALWYAMNPYALVHWHGNGFTPTLIVCYALAPLTFYFLYTSIMERVNSRHLLITSVLLFFMSFALYLHAVFIIFISVVFVLSLLIKKLSIKDLVFRSLKLLTIYLPFLGLHMLIPYDMFTSDNISTNLSGGATYGQLRGGILYPTLLWFSWGIYTIWRPRSLYSFHEYFKSIQYLLASVVPYVLILYGLAVRKKSVLFYIFISTLLFMLFFTKGAQPPFGEIYSYLVENLAIFRLFRSPDNKFGFGVVLAISFLLLYSYRSLQKKYFVIIVLVALFVQSFPLFTGAAIKGENKGNDYFDRVTKIPESHTELSTFINSDVGEFGFVLPIPAQASHLSLGNDTFIGQDIIPKLIKYPFLYVLRDTGTYTSTFRMFDEILDSRDYARLKDFPVKYVLLRRDILREKMPREEDISRLHDEFDVVFENKEFTLFENQDMTRLFSGDVLEFEIISPVKFIVRTNGPNLIFNQSYNSNWKVFEYDGRGGGVSDIKLTFKRPLFDDTHKIYKNYGNSWHVNGGGENTYLVYFKTQAIFYLGFLIVVGYLCVVTFFIFRKTVKK